MPAEARTRMRENVPTGAPTAPTPLRRRLRVKLVDGHGALQLGEQRGQAAEMVAVAVGDQDQRKRADLDAQRAQHGNEAPVRAARARIDKDIFISPDQEGENEAERDGNHRRLHGNDDTPRACVLQHPGPSAEALAQASGGRYPRLAAWRRLYASGDTPTTALKSLMKWAWS